MREIVSKKEAREIVQTEMGKALMAAAYAMNAPPGTTVVIAGETFVVEEGGKLRGTQRKPYVATANVELPDPEAEGSEALKA